MQRRTAGILVAATVLGVTGAQAQRGKPTILLVHGAFADGSSWNGVMRILEEHGFPVIAAANPLRGVRADAADIAAILSSLATPVVLVGHSYGGSVISAAAVGRPNVTSLVYVSAFAPAPGETGAGLAGRFPGSTLGPALAPPVLLPGGGKDLYVDRTRFHEQFAADVPAAEARLMAAAQRPVTEGALNEATGDVAWGSIPSWFIYGDRDKNIPPPAHAFMAERARARQAIVVRGASHVPMVSHPRAVADLIMRAATEA